MASKPCLAETTGRSRRRTGPRVTEHREPLGPALRDARCGFKLAGVAQVEDLFASVLTASEHHAFREVRLSPFHANARALMTATLAEMGDADGNFAISFQSDGFYARVFELACYRYLAGQSLAVSRVGGQRLRNGAPSVPTGAYVLLC
jgi:hypothetical protein